jgi:hypothetical protein
MRLLIELGYNKILFANDVPVGAVIDALNKAVICEETGPYNARKLVRASNVEVAVKLINDDDIALPNNNDAMLDKIIALDKENTAQRTEIYALKQQLKKVQESIAVTPKVDTTEVPF